jgi:hypothetical protein
MYLGFDRLGYPGDAVLAALRDTGRVSFVGVYLGPAPSQPSTGWMPHIADLVAAGWGVIPIYVGQQAPGGPGSHVLTADRGTTDAGNATALAGDAGLAVGSVVYLDIEAGGNLATGHLEYVGAWVGAMRAGTFRPGVYCSARQTARQVTEAVGRLPAWVFRTNGGPLVTVDVGTEKVPDPGDSGYEQAIVWQYRLSLAGSRVDLSWTGETGATRTLDGVDLDASVVPDPSHPFLPLPVITGVTPASGAAGDTVQISGANFLGITDIAFGTVSAAGMTVVDESTLEAVVPDGLAGKSVPLIVTNRWSLSGETIDPFAVTVPPGVDADPVPAP